MRACRKQFEKSSIPSCSQCGQVCSDCFLRILNHRLQSPLLPRSSSSRYLIEEHDDLERFCSTNLPLTTSSQTLHIGTVPLPTPTSSTTTSNPPATTCPGQIIEPPQSPTNCHQLSEKYSVATGDLTVLTGNWECSFTAPICAPLPCPVRKIAWKETCESLRASVSTPENNVTEINFKAWNWRIIGACDNVRGDQYICTGYASTTPFLPLCS